jgi:hypothetical protein
VTRCLCVVSKDFGEYVTANLFTRRQSFEWTIAVPRALAPHARGVSGIVDYSSVDDLDALVRGIDPHVVVLCSAYLFSINGLIAPQALVQWIGDLRARGVVVATTDPWLRVWAFNATARFTIYSVREGGIDAQATARVMKLQALLEHHLHDLPHVFAVPLEKSGVPWLPFFNPSFATARRPGAATESDTWLFVLSAEDYAFLRGFGGAAFLAQLQARLADVMASSRNRVVFVGPPELGMQVKPTADTWPRFEYVPFCDFETFERLVADATIAVYWNALSSSLLYCLYQGVRPIFFGRGHQAMVLPALYDHAVAHVYAGDAPIVLDMAQPLESDAAALDHRYGLGRWLSAVCGAYEGLPTPESVMNRLLETRDAA